MTTPHGENDTAIAQWLAESLDTPQAVWGHWRVGPVAMLPAGRRFDAVRMPGDLVHASLGATDHATLSAGLDLALAGPVICDTRWYYALVPPRTSERWTSGLATCLGTGTWLTVPRPDRTDDTGTGIHWCVSMAYPGRLCDPADVAGLLREGHERLSPPVRKFRRRAAVGEPS
ncbi:hypothetical protein [Streptomyces sp. NPDC001985]|uniref:hypothetical protein n=1 Tax=Streptomyces sp. NPDC001985 TaxID=3154406 RepID=UPI00332807F9